jgi:mannose-6-phosphate isomerase-like protein (cupin superfamily)
MASQRKIQYTINDIGGEVVKDNETYLLKDNKTLDKLVLSSTLLNPFKQTTGHNHSGQEEVYFFVSGQGRMEVDEKTLLVTAGDVVLVPDGSFHRVYNETTESLYFVCVFDGKRNH